MQLNQAKQIAEKYCELLHPYCHRVEIAGSIRRKKPEVKDIEIVCIPKRMPLNGGLFGYSPDELVTDPGFDEIINSLEKIKGEPGGKYTQRKLTEGINLDLFICFKRNWGNIFAIRTGSAEYSHKVLATGWVKKGFKGIDGFLYKGKTRIDLFEEEDLFRLLGIPWIEPEKREI